MQNKNTQVLCKIILHTKKTPKKPNKQVLAQHNWSDEIISQDKLWKKHVLHVYHDFCINKFQNYIGGWNKHHNILFQKHGFKICVVKCSIYFLTTPSGSTNNKCLIMPFCLPLRTNWLGSLELFLTRKSPSFCRSFSACFLGRAPWYHSSNMGAMLFRLPVGFGLSGIGVPFIWGRVSHTALSSMGFSGTPFCLDLCLGGGNSALKGSKKLKITCCLVHNIYYLSFKQLKLKTLLKIWL